jgi:DNA ligase (NAD+)
MDLDRMRFLVDLLNSYTKAYDEGNPIVSDKEWDDLYFELQDLEKKSGVILGNSPTAHISYQVINQ